MDGDAKYSKAGLASIIEITNCHNFLQSSSPVKQYLVRTCKGTYLHQACSNATPVPESSFSDGQSWASSIRDEPMRKHWSGGRRPEAKLQGFRRHCCELTSGIPRMSLVAAPSSRKSGCHS